MFTVCKIWVFVTGKDMRRSPPTETGP